MEAEIRVTELQPKKLQDHQEPPRLGRGDGGFSPGACEGAQLCRHLEP